MVPTMRTVSLIGFSLPLTCALGFFGLVACGNGQVDGIDDPSEKGSAAGGYSQQVPVEGTPLEAPTYVTPEGALDAAVPAAEEGGPAIGSDAGASPDAADGSVSACKRLGKCCSEITACDGEVLACMRVTLADDEAACATIMSRYDVVGCNHSGYAFGPNYSNYTNFSVCPRPEHGGR